MKKKIIMILSILILTLTACGSAASTGAQPSSVTLTDSYEDALPIQTQLIIGTFKLEGTDWAVTAEQATDLLPLWQVLQDLNDSDTAAQEEINALVDQIQETMTPEQIQAIVDMQLTQQDIFTIMQEQGVTKGNSQQDSNSQSSSSSFTPPQGGPPEGMPDGGLPGSTGQALSPEQIATAQAARAQGSGGFNRIPSGLIDALIQLLEKKAQP